MNIAKDADIFGLGRAAAAASHSVFAGQAFFVGTRHLQQDLTWLGPADAVAAVVEEEAAVKVGLPVALRAGANTLLCQLTSVDLMREAIALGLRCLVRVPFAAGESPVLRSQRLEQLTALLGQLSGLDGVVPTPMGEALGLDTVQFFAACRLASPTCHVVVDLALLGHKLGQLCLSFGADELLGSIVNQRALRLGAHASSNAITRDEAVLLLRASGFVPCERLAEGRVQAL